MSCAGWISRPAVAARPSSGRAFAVQPLGGKHSSQVACTVARVFIAPQSFFVVHCAIMVTAGIIFIFAQLITLSAVIAIMV